MKGLLPALAILVVARMTLHAFFLPAFEGPDEPHHLARVLAFAREPFPSAFAGREIPADVVAAVRARPCSPSVNAAYGCPPFAGRQAAFNLLRAEPDAGQASPAPNPEANQPPLAYVLAGLPLRLEPGSVGVGAALLYVRLFSVALVALALFGPLRTVARRWPAAVSAAGLLALLLPGASEALARASNDAAVFLWAACVVAALEGRPRSSWMVLLIAAGPLIKLTAIPVVAFAIVALILDGRRSAALAGALGALAVFPVQAARGWLWGGTLELNSPTATIAEPFGQSLLGFARSGYACVKTTFWVGGWTFQRPPLALAVAYLALLLAAGLAWRLRPAPRRWVAHAAAFAVAAAGFVVFALANRRLYGGWGGVAGWYLWDWSPWIAVAANDLGAIPPDRGRSLLAVAALFVVLSNLLWFAASVRLYGG